MQTTRLLVISLLCLLACHTGLCARRKGTIRTKPAPIKFPRPRFPSITVGGVKRPIRITRPANQSWLYPRPPQVTPPTTEPVPPVNNVNPVDLSSILTNVCGQGAAVDFSNMFKDLFMTDHQVDLVVESEKKQLRQAGTRRRGNRLQQTQMTKTIGKISTLSGLSGQTSGDTCCETELLHTRSTVVNVSGAMMPLIALGNSYQFVDEGRCLNEGAQCRTTGRCYQMTKKTYMLVYDQTAASRVRFVPVTVPSHCECQNIGV